MADLPRVSIAELAEFAGGAAARPPLEAAGQVAQPLVAVDLDGGAPQAVLARAAARARDYDRLLVGITSGPLSASVRPLLAALDLTLARRSARPRLAGRSRLPARRGG